MMQRVLRSITDLGPLTELLARHDVEEIFVEGARVTYLDTSGRLRGLAEPTTEDENRQILDRLLADTERQLNAKHPMVQARVLDGTARLTAAIPPVADRLSATVRRYTVRDVTLDELVARDALSAPAADVLVGADAAAQPDRDLGRARRGQDDAGRGAARRRPGESLRAVLRGDPRARRRRSRTAPTTRCGPPGLDGTGEISLRDLVKFVLAMRPGSDRRRRGARRRGVRADARDQRRLRLHVHGPRQQRARGAERAGERGADGRRERDRAHRAPGLLAGARRRRARRPRRRAAGRGLRAAPGHGDHGGRPDPRRGPDVRADLRARRRSVDRSSGRARSRPGSKHASIGRLPRGTHACATCSSRPR